MYILFVLVSRKSIFYKNIHSPRASDLKEDLGIGLIMILEPPFIRLSPFIVEMMYEKPFIVVFWKYEQSVSVLRYSSVVGLVVMMIVLSESILCDVV